MPVPTRRLLLLLALPFVASTAASTAASAQAALERIFLDLPDFDSWTSAVRVAGNDDNRFYVVELAGRIRSFVREPDVTEAPVFLDITDRVFYNDSHGMPGLAFHPDYATNGYFYVTYITEEDGGPGQERLSRFTAVPDKTPPVADPDSEVILFEVEGTTWDHTGGDLHFGPDGYLYVSLGDEDCCGDPRETGQDPSDLLASILRLDVDNPAPGLNYGIPPDNPFVGNTQGWREEVFAYGFRNPWRFSIDPVTGHVWVGDVGNFEWEEVDLVEAGGNYGWDDVEGPECFEVPACDLSAYTAPVWSYDHSVGYSVTGGYVYRGSLIPDLYGQYIFADWGSQKLWALAYDPDSGEPAEVTVLSESVGLAIVSFGVDEDGELYALRTFNGAIWQLVPAPKSATEPGNPSAEEPTLRLWPNPATSELHVSWPWDQGVDAVTVHDVLGRRVLSAPVVGGSTRLRLDLTALPPGVYVVRVGERMQPFTVVR